MRAPLASAIPDLDMVCIEYDQAELHAQVMPPMHNTTSTRAHVTAQPCRRHFFPWYEALPARQPRKPLRNVNTGYAENAQ